MSEELRRGIPKATVIGQVTFTAEEKTRHKRDFEKILKEMGVLGKDETIDDMEEVCSLRMRCKERKMQG